MEGNINGSFLLPIIIIAYFPSKSMTGRLQCVYRMVTDSIRGLPPPGKGALPEVQPPKTKPAGGSCACRGLVLKLCLHRAGACASAQCKYAARRLRGRAHRLRCSRQNKTRRRKLYLPRVDFKALPASGGSLRPCSMQICSPPPLGQFAYFAAITAFSRFFSLLQCLRYFLWLPQS